MNLAKRVRLENADKQVAIRYSNNSVGSNAINFGSSGFTCLIETSNRLFDFAKIMVNVSLIMTVFVCLFRDVILKIRKRRKG